MLSAGPWIIDTIKIRRLQKSNLELTPPPIATNNKEICGFATLLDEAQ